MMQDISIILKYFPELTSAQKEKFSLLPSVYKEWNEKINVISRKDIDQINIHHVLHSLAIAKLIGFKPGTEILDIGTGGGFPGIPLSIMFPEARFRLVDSIGKKIKVVNEVASALNLENIVAENLRAENVEGKFDFIVSRAVAPFPELYSWTRDKVKKQSMHDLANGFLFLKGGDLTEELKAFSGVIQIELSDFYNEEFFGTKKLVYMPKRN